MSDCERFTQIAQDKWATMSDSLRSLMINEWISDSLKKCWQKIQNIIFSMFYPGFLYLENEQFAHSLVYGEQCEQISQVAHQKWAMWANRSNCSPKMSKWANCLFFWAKNERFAQKTLPCLYAIYSKCETVLRIRIHRIRIILPDPEPDP